MTEQTLQKHEAQDETLSLTRELELMRQHKADEQAEAERDWTDGNFGPSYFDNSQPH